jgi:hypothetical protein
VDLDRFPIRTAERFPGMTPVYRHPSGALKKSHEPEQD